jgi:hypothetical protein
MQKIIIITVLCSLVWLMACHQGTDQSKTTEQQKADSIAQCAKEPVKDPNNPKPMALMMRQMAENADSIRAQLLRGETPDAQRYPFIRFYMAEPTDLSVLEPQFYENARMFQEAYKAFFSSPESSRQNFYNALIQKCVNCHEHYCSGPLKRIRKLPI